MVQSFQGDPGRKRKVVRVKYSTNQHLDNFFFCLPVLRRKCCHLLRNLFMLVNSDLTNTDGVFFQFTITFLFATFSMLVTNHYKSKYEFLSVYIK